MDEIELSYREIIPDQTNVQIRKDITINTGSYNFRLCFCLHYIVVKHFNANLFTDFISTLLFFFYIGSTQSTLQDIKVIEKAGGFCYNDSTYESKRNRFIYWYDTEA